MVGYEGVWIGGKGISWGVVVGGRVLEDVNVRWWERWRKVSERWL